MLKKELLTQDVFNSVVRSSSGYAQEFRENTLNYTSYYDRKVDYDLDTPKKAIRTIDGSNIYTPNAAVQLDIPHLLYDPKSKREVFGKTKSGITLAEHGKMSKRTIEVEINGKKIPDSDVRIVVCHNGSTLLLPVIYGTTALKVFKMGENDIHITVKNYRAHKYMNHSAQLRPGVTGMITKFMATGLTQPVAYLRVYKGGKLLPPCVMQGETPLYPEHYFTISDGGVLVYNYTGDLHEETKFEIIDDYSISGIYYKKNSNGQIVIPQSIFDDIEGPLSVKQVKIYRSDGDRPEHLNVNDRLFDRISHRVYEIPTVEETHSFIIRVYDNVYQANELLRHYSDDIVKYMKFFKDDDLHHSVFAPEAGDFTLNSIKEYYDNLLDDPEEEEGYNLESDFSDRVDFMKALISTNSNNFNNYLSNFSDHKNRLYTEDATAIESMIIDNKLTVHIKDHPGKDAVFVIYNGYKVPDSHISIQEGVLGNVEVVCDVSKLDTSEHKSLEIFTFVTDDGVPKTKKTVDSTLRIKFNRSEIGMMGDDKFELYMRSRSSNWHPELPSPTHAFDFDYLENIVDYTIESDDPVTGEIVVKFKPTMIIEGDIIMAANTRFRFCYTYVASEKDSSVRGHKKLSYYDDEAREIVPIPVDSRYRIDVYSAGKYFVDGLSLFTAPQGQPPERSIAEIVYRRIPERDDIVEVYFTGTANSTYSAIEVVDKDNKMAIIHASDLHIPYDPRYCTCVIDGRKIPRSRVLSLSPKTIKILDEELPFIEFAIITEFDKYGVSDFGDLITAFTTGSNILDQAMAYHCAAFDYAKESPDSDGKIHINAIMENSPYDDEYTLINPVSDIVDDTIDYNINPLVNKYIEDIFNNMADKLIDANRFIQLPYDQYGVYIPKNENLLTVMKFDPNKQGIVSINAILNANFAGLTKQKLKIALVQKMYKNMLKLKLDPNNGDDYVKLFNANKGFGDVYIEEDLDKVFGLFEWPYKEAIIDANDDFGVNGALNLNANHIVKLFD
jgi:hypothetical protein